MAFVEARGPPPGGPARPAYEDAPLVMRRNRQELADQRAPRRCSVVADTCGPISSTRSSSIAHVLRRASAREPQTSPGRLPAGDAEAQARERSPPISSSADLRTEQSRGPAWAGARATVQGRVRPSSPASPMGAAGKRDLGLHARFSRLTEVRRGGLRARFGSRLLLEAGRGVRTQPLPQRRSGAPSCRMRSSPPPAGAPRSSPSSTFEAFAPHHPGDGHGLVVRR